MARTPDSPGIWGGMMDMGYPKGAATLVCLRDGTTSMYTSSGGGVIGGGEHDFVVRTNKIFLAELARQVTSMREDADESLPAAGRIVFRALTYDGPLTFRATEDALARGGSALSPVFFAAHDVLTQLRILSEGQ